MAENELDSAQSAKKLTEFKRKNEFPAGKQRAALRPIQQVHSLIQHPTRLGVIDEGKVVNEKAETFNATYEKGLEQFFCDVRSSNALQPANMRRSLTSTSSRGSRRSFLFRAGFNDLVNDCMRLDRDPCLLSSSFRENDLSRSLFFKQITQNRDWIAIPSLVRKIDHLFYARVEFTDVLMFHPTAWGFPEADLNRNMVGVAGKERDPMHGWLSQTARNADSEMQDVSFGFRFTVRRIPHKIIQIIASGSLPEWLEGVSSISADTSKIEPLLPKTAVPWGVGTFLRAGLVDEEDVYLKVSDLSKTRLLEPDSLESSTRLSFSVRGMNGLRACLAAYSRSSCPITPGQVEAMAFQLGIGGNHHFYWFAYFALRYPLPFGWVVVVSDKVRSYIKLECGHTSFLHPLLKQFKQLLHEFEQSEILFDTRGCFTPPCDECGVPDAVLLCSQCTDMMCVCCFLKVHANRHKNHWAIPVAGCRYLTQDEAEKLDSFIPHVNVGFCNRRRFLARSNQSDKTGPCQCSWLHFDSDIAFDSVYSGQCGERTSAMDGSGFLYNFKTHAIVFSSSEFAEKATLEQTAILNIQRCFRGFLSRRTEKIRARAAVAVQKNIRMVLARKRFGKTKGENPLTVWLRIFRLRMQRDKFLRGVNLVQAHVRGMIEIGRFASKRNACIKVQAVWRGVLARRQLEKITKATAIIQAVWRGFWLGRKRVSDMHVAACILQARARGILTRTRWRELKKSSIRIQALIRGALARGQLENRLKKAILIQTWWRRFSAIIAVKRELVSEIQSSARRFDDLIRRRAVGFAAVEIQRVFRGHYQRKKYWKLVQTKQTVSRTVTSLTAMFLLSLSQLHVPFHAWNRYLPEGVAEKLERLKSVIQRAIVDAGQDVACFLIQEILRDAVKTCGEADNAGCMHWISHTLTHLGASLSRNSKTFTMRSKSFGEEVPARIQDPLPAFLKKSEKAKSVLDGLIRMEDVNLFLSAASNTASPALHAALTSSLLVTYREFLNQPRLRPESMLSFQGVDSVSAAQLLDLVGYELGLSSLPVAEWASGVGKTSCVKIEECLREFVCSPIDYMTGEFADQKSRYRIGFVSQREVWRSLQQIGRLARLEIRGEKYQKHITEVGLIITAARSETAQEHFAYITAVSLLHAIHRGLIMRQVSQTAATSIQVAFRYFKTRTLVKRISGPVLIIQRHWRGLKAALDMYRKDRAAFLIQTNFRIVLAQRRSRKLVNSVAFIQAFWRGAIHRKWIRTVEKSAIKIQALFRAHLVRLVLGTQEGRSVRRALREKVKLFSDPARIAAVKLELRKNLEEMKLKAVASKRSRAKTAQKKIEQYRKAIKALNKSSVNTQKVMRQSVFEPICFVVRRNLPVRAENEISRVGSLVPAADRINRQLESWLKLIG